MKMLRYDSLNIIDHISDTSLSVSVPDTKDKYMDGPFYCVGDYGYEYLDDGLDLIES